MFHYFKSLYVQHMIMKGQSVHPKFSDKKKKKRKKTNKKKKKKKIIIYSVFKFMNLGCKKMFEEIIFFLD